MTQDTNQALPPIPSGEALNELLSKAAHLWSAEDIQGLVAFLRSKREAFLQAKDIELAGGAKARSKRITKQPKAPAFRPLTPEGQLALDSIKIEI
jgi:hypothetical protein